jgi:hypothetical protein
MYPPHDLRQTHTAYLLRYLCRIYEGRTKGYGDPDDRALLGDKRGQINKRGAFCKAKSTVVIVDIQNALESRFLN